MTDGGRSTEPAAGRHDWDPTDADTSRDPHATHARLRAGCPVAHSNKWGGFWTLTKYEDIVAATVDKTAFSARQQTIVPSSPRKGLPRLPLQSDPPEHTAYRRALNPYFTEARIAALESPVRMIASDLLSAIRPAAATDMVEAYAGRFSVDSLCLFVGLEASEGARLKQLSDDYVRAIQATDHGTAAPLSQAVDELAIDLVADRKKHPRDPAGDIASGLLAGRPGSASFSDVEVAGMIRLLLIGGHTVTKNFLGSAIGHIAGDADLQARLRRDPHLIPAAVEELLRLYSPNQALVRTTTQDVSIRGQAIPAGCPVAMLYISANRDEDVFADPERFVLDRTPNAHVAFGHGIHKCIGQALARMQARVALEELLRQTARFGVGGPFGYAAWPEYGIDRLPLRLDWA